MGSYARKGSEHTQEGRKVKQKQVVGVAAQLRGVYKDNSYGGALTTLRIRATVKVDTGDGYDTLVEGSNSLPTALCSIRQASGSQRKDDDDGEDAKKSL